MKQKTFVALLLLLSLSGSSSWSNNLSSRPRQHTRASRDDGEVHSSKSSRRQFLHRALLSSTGVVLSSQPNQVKAVLSEENKIFTGEPLSVGFAKERFKLARKDLQYLLDHYDEICEGGGDSVRRYLGYVGTTSGLFGIQKVLKTLQEEADDFVTFTEDMEEFNSYLAGAEGAAYSAIFVVTSTSQTPPSKYFNDAKKNIKKMKLHMDNMAEELKF